MMHKACSGLEEVPHCFSRSSIKFQGYTGWKIYDFDPNWGFPNCKSSLNSQMVTKWCKKAWNGKEEVPLFLSHPSLGWLYVFSSFPPPPPPPPPPPQWLLLLKSKRFELHLRYLGQRKYRSGKMYWMTFWWPWPKVTAVTLINKNLLVCRIKWEPFNQSLQNLVAISPWSCLSQLSNPSDLSSFIFGIALKGVGVFGITLVTVPH